MSRALLLVLGTLALVPTAAAADLLATEAVLGPTEARLVVRVREGELLVRAEPPVLAGARGEEPAPTPRALRPGAPWRGMEDVVELVLRREDPRQAVELALEDASRTGALVTWPAADAAVPGSGVVVALTAAGLVGRGLSGRDRIR